MEKKYYIQNLGDGKYYCRFPAGFTYEIVEAVSFDSEEEAETRIKEILMTWQTLIIVTAFIKRIP